MKDILCFAAFVAKVLCLVLFVVALRPGHISAVHETEPAYCKTSRAAAPACGVSVVAALVGAGAGRCRAAPEGAPTRSGC